MLKKTNKFYRNTDEQKIILHFNNCFSFETKFEDIFECYGFIFNFFSYGADCFAVAVFSPQAIGLKPHKFCNINNFGTKSVQKLKKTAP